MLRHLYIRYINYIFLHVFIPVFPIITIKENILFPHWLLWISCKILVDHINVTFLLGSFFHCPTKSFMPVPYWAGASIVCIQIMWWLQLALLSWFFWLFEFFVIQYFNFYFYWWNILAVVNANSELYGIVNQSQAYSCPLVS